jgi:hypothetical protein
MPSGDSRKPSQRSGQPPADERAEGPPTPKTDGGEAGATEAGTNVDFGSYVSSTVRSSAELFGTPARSASSRSRKQASPGRPADSGRISQPPAEPAGRADDGPAPVPVARERSARRWRDTAGFEQVHVQDEIPDDDGSGNGGDYQDRFPWAFQEDGRPNWTILGGILLALLALILLVWYLAGRGGDGGEPTPTPTEESVINAPLNGTEEDDDSTPSVFVPRAPTQSDEPTATQEPRRGGDNQRNAEDDEGTPGATTGDPLDGIELGPVASSCQERCLVRIADDGEADQLMADANTRASFSAEGWDWVIAEPDGIAWFEQNTDTTLVTESTDTLALYMTLVPNEETSDDRVKSFGTILDSVGQWRLVQVGSVPANVRPLTDWGYQVEKVAPAPPVEVVGPEEPVSLASIEIGSLIDDVSESNLESSITDLVGMGATDGSGIGTRYYTSASNMMAAEYLFTQLESYGLNVWYEDFLTWEGYLVVNVIGEVPGEDESEIYGVMAHFDTISTDLAVSPGADDNATGVSASLEIARVLSEYELHHPVRIIFVNVEEVGIVGSERFAQNAKEQGIPYEGVFNLDSIGAQRQYSYVVLNGDATTTWMTDLYVQINDAYGLHQTINPMTNDAIVADDNRLREYGIDSIMIGRELYGQSPYHHTPGDTPDTLSMLGVLRCTQLTLVTLASLAQG